MGTIVHDIERDALNVGAYQLKEKVKENFIAKFPNATKPVRPQTITGGYKLNKSQPLVDAVRQSRYKNNTVKVHVLGAHEANSPLFIARFYEDGTKDRYARTYKGKKLKKKRWLGKIDGYKYFKPTVEEQLDSVTEVIGEVYEHKLDQFLERM